MTARFKRFSLVLGLVLFSSFMISIGFLVLGDSVSLYYLPHQIDRHVVGDDVISLGGIIVSGSLSKEVVDGELFTFFKLSDPLNINFRPTIDVEHRGIIPVLLAETQGVVLHGKFTDPISWSFLSTRLLMKHGENYSPYSQLKP